MDLAVEERPRRQYHGSGPESDAHLGHGAHHAVALHHQVIDRLLEQHQVRLVFQPGPNRLAIQHTIRLGARGADGRPLAGVENTELDTGLVRGRRHRTAHRVHFLDQMPLANAANRRIAAHLTQRLDVMAQQQRLAAHAGGGKRGFGAGVTTTDDNDIELFRVKHGTPPPGGWAGKFQDAEL
ncbi:hypothetical protein D3C86_1713630 [compost metagenome]